jgi:hypothetical protein
MKQTNDPLEKLPIKEVYGQLLAILTNRRRTRSEGGLIIGYAINELSTILNKSVEETNDLLSEFNEFLLGLGLSIITFQIEQKDWVAVKSLYAAPIELQEDELAVLGTIIMLHSEPKIIKVETQKIIDYLTKREYFNEYKIKKIIKSLIDSGYVQKATSGGLTFGPRTLIEINDESRRFIAQQASDLLF